ncbi:hypothetical protein Tco_0606604, partial [Tanacetum coccineum]
ILRWLREHEYWTTKWWWSIYLELMWMAGTRTRRWLLLLSVAEPANYSQERRAYNKAAASFAVIQAKYNICTKTCIRRKRLGSVAIGKIYDGKLELLARSSQTPLLQLKILETPGLNMYLGQNIKTANCREPRKMQNGLVMVQNGQIAEVKTEIELYVELHPFLERKCHSNRLIKADLLTQFLQVVEKMKLPWGSKRNLMVFQISCVRLRFLKVDFNV